MQSHASNPVAVAVDDETARVYFSTRDKRNRSHITSLTIEYLSGKWRVSTPPHACILAPGREGLFDENGVSMGCILRREDEDFLYYLGWRLGDDVPWRNFIGLAKGDAATGDFEKISETPILDRSDADPHSVSYPCIIEDAGIYKMYYGSNADWDTDIAAIRHYIKMASSSDGKNWQCNEKVLINPTPPDDHAFSRPWVLKRDDDYWMWYSVRGDKYRIGFAWSRDGDVWQRDDANSGITVSDIGWDSEAVCYPSIFTLQNKIWMLYNGNGYGKTGFGIAEFIE